VVNLAVTALLVLALGFGVAGAALGALVAEVSGTAAGIVMALRIVHADTLTWDTVLDRGKLMRMFVVNRDILLRTAALIAAWGFFAAQGARSGDVVLAANAVLHNLVLMGAFFLDGFAAAAEQLCGRSIGARDPKGFRRAARLSLGWGFGFGVAATLVFIVAGPWLIALMTASPEVRAIAQQFLIYAALASAIGVFAFGYDGIYIGATWTRDMRNLMLASLLIYLASWWVLRPFGNSGLWISILIFLAARGALQAARYPALAKATFT